MSFLQSLILGIIQGITEFLPISSSGHLVIVPWILGWNIPQSQVFPFDVLVQIGTLIAVILYFWRDLWTIIKAFFKGLSNRKPFEDQNARLGWYLILATIPAGIAGLLLKNQVETAFNDARSTAWFLFGTALLLLAAEFFSKHNRNLEGLKWLDALWMGLFQALSIFPGVSRSGSTIAGGMTRNLDRPSAARFSFLMSIPVMLAAGLVSLPDLFQIPELGAFLPILAVGFIAALLVGYLSIHWLLSFLAKRSLAWFAVYCILLGSAVLIISGFRFPQSAQAIENTQAPAQKTSAALSPGSSDPIVKVEYTSSVAWLTPAMTSCAESVPGLSLIVYQVTGNPLSPSSDAILLRWGAPPALTGFAADLGSDRLALVVHPENSLSSLTPELIRRIAGNQYSSWDEIYQSCADCFSAPPDEDLKSNQPGLYFFDPAEEIQAFFEAGLLGGSPVAVAAGFRVPSIDAMRQAVAESTSAFGYLPSRSVDGTVKEIAIANFDSARLQFPLLAQTDLAPVGYAKEWLICMQQVLNP